MKCRCLFLFTLVVAGLTIFRNSLPARADQPTTAPDQNMAEMHKLVDQLSNPDPIQREWAVVNIEYIAFSNIPIVTDLVKKADLNAATRTAVARALARHSVRAKWSDKQRDRNLVVTAWLYHCVLEDATAHSNGKAAWLDEVKKTVELRIKEDQVSTLAEQQDIQAQTRKHIDAALTAGCNDPAFLTLNGLFSNQMGATAEERFALFSKAREKSKGVQVSPYMTIVTDRRMMMEWAMVWAAELQMSRK